MNNELPGYLRQLPRLTSGHALLAATATMLCGLIGCGDSEQITRYTIPNETPATDTVAADQSSRMLAAIVPYEGRAWFFKVTGPDKALQEQSEAFRTFIGSLSFDGQRPQWQLPEGWQEQPGDGVMRVATVRLSTDPALEMSIIPLDMPPGDDTQYVLSNVNRWRNQLQLPPITAEQLPDEVEEVDIEGSEPATIVELVGTASTDSMMPPAGMPPFASAPFAGGAAPLAGGGAASGPGPKLSYDKPADWQQGQEVVSRGGITIRREAAFTVGAGDQQAEITVTALPGRADPLANVNRWRGQVCLSPIDQQELDEAAQPIDIADQQGEYVKFEGPEGTILAATLTEAGRTWFFKLQGPAELAAQQEESFKEFVASTRFGSDEGAQLDGQQ